jgi:predicted CXXCH cytochrome family protein
VAAAQLAACARRLSIVLLVAGGAAGVAAAIRSERRAVATDLATPRDLHGAAASYVGSIACRRCHEDHYRSWHRTFHRTMTQEASPRNAAAVLGDFSGATYRYDGVEARMDRDSAGAFRMTFTSLTAPSSPPVTAIISRAVGSRRYQQYLTRVGDAEYRLPIAFHVEEQRWFPMNGAFLFPSTRAPAAPAASVSAGAPTFGGGDYDRHVTRWNDNCVFCHNVAPNPGRDQATGGFRTQVAEMGVACEACHGPGGQHARANRDPVRRYTLNLGGAADPTIVNPSRLSPARSADLCGRCHGQRITDDIGPFLDHGDPFVPGDDLALYSAPLWQDTSMGQQRAPFAARFWADGTPRLTAYEYQGFLQSRCTQQGDLTCTTCHGMHDGDPRGQLRPGAVGDQACTGCHGGLASDAAKLSHTHHASGGAGARCVSCHMPRIVYGVLEIHRSHRIEVPDPARAARFGRPDACTGCHVDETQTWAAAALQRLWGHAGAGADNDAKEAAGATDLGPLTAVLAGDPIERAVAADAFGRSRAPAGPAARAVRAGLLLDAMADDDYPAVRHLAWRALGRLLSAPTPPAVAAYDPTGPVVERRALVERIRRALPPATVTAPAPVSIASLRAAARDVAIEIGE